MKTYNFLKVNSRKEWREWLNENHKAEREIWLVYHKKHTGVPSVEYVDSVEEALCFGWIDSIIKKIDENKYARKFTPRTNTLKWSELNKARARKMIESGKMTRAGYDKIDEKIFKQKPEEKTPVRPVLELPPELENLLKKNPKAWKFFNSLAPSHKRNYIGWVTDAKKEETRKRRLEQAIILLISGQKLGIK